MNLKAVNTWWHKGFDKERARFSNAPKPFKGDRFSVPTNFSSEAPSMPPTKKVHARHHR